MRGGGGVGGCTWELRRRRPAGEWRRGASSRLLALYETLGGRDTTHRRLRGTGDAEKPLEFLLKPRGQKYRLSARRFTPNTHASPDAPRASCWSCSAAREPCWNSRQYTCEVETQKFLAAHEFVFLPWRTQESPRTTSSQWVAVYSSLACQVCRSHITPGFFCKPAHLSAPAPSCIITLLYLI